jgi:hypothetical protein
VIDEIAQFIEDQTHGYFEVGRNLFVGFLPQETAGVPVPTRCAVVLENVPARVEGQLPDLAEKFIQIWNRAADFHEARDDAYVIYEVLHGASGWHLPVVTIGEPNYFAMTIDALGTPAPIRAPNDKGDFEFSTNYVFRIEAP